MNPSWLGEYGVEGKLDVLMPKIARLQVTASLMRDALDTGVDAWAAMYELKVRVEGSVL